jgi:hypothetical protein
MSYTKQIFNEMKAIDPNITVREFSYRCGKSEGYYGSLISQELELSDEAIINLLETLEMWKLILAKTPNNTVDKIHRIGDVQKDLTRELAKRTSTNHSTQNNEVRKLIINAVVHLYQSKTNADTSIPFVF